MVYNYKKVNKRGIEVYNQSKLIALLKEEQSRYEHLIGEMERKKKDFLEGSLVYKEGKYYRAVTYQGRRLQIMLREEYPDYNRMLRQLKEKRYITKALPILRKNLLACRKAAGDLEVYDPKSLGVTMPDYYRNFQDKGIYLEGDIDPAAWASAEYETNTLRADDRIHPSEKGLLTRSKAEAPIATKLEQNGLIFRYEPVLYLGRKKCFPDFAVLHPLNRKKIYWEHFGKMDDMDYAAKNIAKLWDYAEHGYYLGDNLIMTWETKWNPLTFQQINERIQKYFF